jgi:hypothetical protein
MSATLAYCAVFMVGLGPAEVGGPVAPLPSNPSAQPTYSQQAQLAPATARQAPATPAPTPHLRMPLPPTDPRVLVSGYLPLPPTMTGTGTPATVDLAGPGPRRDQAVASGDNGIRRLVPQKPFEHYAPASATSPYMLMDSPTANGTISPYMAYVRPAQEQMLANRELDRAAGDGQGGSDQPGPSYPRFFLNYGSYYPGIPGERQ